MLSALKERVIKLVLISTHCLLVLIMFDEPGDPFKCFIITEWLAKTCEGKPCKCVRRVSSRREWGSSQPSQTTYFCQNPTVNIPLAIFEYEELKYLSLKSDHRTDRCTARVKTTTLCPICERKSVMITIHPFLCCNSLDCISPPKPLHLSARNPIFMTNNTTHTHSLHHGSL